MLQVFLPEPADTSRSAILGGDFHSSWNPEYENMKRLCFISRFASSLFYPDLEPVHGGSETQCYLNSRELAKDPNLDVHLILQGEPLPNPDIINDVRIHPFPFKTGWIARTRFQCLLKSINADVYIQQGISSTTK